MTYVYLLQSGKLQRSEMKADGLQSSISGWMSGDFSASNNAEVALSDDPNLTIEEFRKLPRRS